MDVHRAALHDVKAGCRIALVKQVFAPFQRLDQRGLRNRLQIHHGQAGEKLATAQRIDDGQFFEFGERGGHDKIQAVPRQK